MLERIKAIMFQKGLSPSGFADAIQVQRSSISHILNGRNKPSLELIQKIIAAFPDIDIEWLLTGKKSFIKEKEIANAEIKSDFVQPDLENTCLNINENEIDKIVIFYKNGTFKLYQPM
ncbi:MAG: helix-turn-helix domain-containing protein [Bacteroidia bacterium]